VCAPPIIVPAGNPKLLIRDLSVTQFFTIPADRRSAYRSRFISIFVHLGGEQSTARWCFYHVMHANSWFI
jgi:hypothetical protein